MILKELLVINSTFNKNKIIIYDKIYEKTYYNFNFPIELLNRKVLTFHVLGQNLYIRIY